jgi:hypothetical protein
MDDLEGSAVFVVNEKGKKRHFTGASSNVHESKQSAVQTAFTSSISF